MLTSLGTKLCQCATKTYLYPLKNFEDIFSNHHFLSQPALMVSDSLAVFATMVNSNSSHPLVFHVLILLSYMANMNTSLSFAWVPFLTGIAGNEKVDISPPYESPTRATKTDQTISIRYLITTHWNEHRHNQYPKKH